MDGCIGCMFSARLPALSLLSSLLAVGGWGLATRRRKSPDPGPTERAPGLAASASLTGLHGLAPFGRLLGGCDSAAQQGQFVLDYSLDENLGFSRCGRGTAEVCGRGECGLIGGGAGPGARVQGGFGSIPSAPILLPTPAAHDCQRLPSPT